MRGKKGVNERESPLVPGKDHHVPSRSQAEKNRLPLGGDSPTLLSSPLIPHLPPLGGG